MSEVRCWCGRRARARLAPGRETAQAAYAYCAEHLAEALARYRAWDAARVPAPLPA